MYSTQEIIDASSCLASQHICLELAKAFWRWRYCRQRIAKRGRCHNAQKLPRTYAILSRLAQKPVRIVQKPFSLRLLCATIQEALAAGNEGIYRVQN